MNQELARILIVDDVSKNIQVLGTILKQQSYQIYVAQNGAQALKIAEEAQPDLILLDVMMPELDGFETCRHLKLSPKTRQIPVIFLTAKVESEDVIRGFEAGAVDYVTKPFKPVELLARVRTQLEIKANRDALYHISNERKELLHILCHDLANPVNAMISVLSVIDSETEFHPLKDMLLAMAQNGLELIDLVRKMRNLEEHSLSLLATSLAQAVYTSLQLLDAKIKAKQLVMQIEIAPQVHILAERTSLIHSVLNNLLTNAIKFSYPHSTILIRAEVINQQIELSIQDQGIGMPNKLLTEIFDVSKPTSRVGTQGELGTGFGMPLVKKFMDAYGGDIQIFSKDIKQSPKNHGTLIKLYFRIAN